VSASLLVNQIRFSQASAKPERKFSAGFSGGCSLKNRKTDKRVFGARNSLPLNRGLAHQTPFIEIELIWARGKEILTR